MGQHHLGQGAQFFLAVHAAGGVAGRAEYEHAGGGGDGGFQLLGGDFEVLLEASLDDHGAAAGQFHHLRVAHPIGGGDDDLLALVDEGEHGVAHALLGTVRHYNLGGCVVEAVLAFQFGGDGLAQVGIAGHGRVARVVVAYGLVGGLFDVVGRVEVGFAHAQVDHVDALRFHLTAALRHHQGGRCGQPVQTVG